MATPVSLPLQSTIPPMGSTIIPPSLQTALNSVNQSSSGPSEPSPSSPIHSLPGSTNTATSTNTKGGMTRVLLLSNFSKDLKTRDIQQAFSDYQDAQGGFKIKWRDDSSAWIVFEHYQVAKRAYLRFLCDKPAPLDDPTDEATLMPYNGPDLAQIFNAVQNRTRSRSIQQQPQQPSTGNNAAAVNLGHARRPSSNGPGAPLPPSSSSASGHARSGSFGTGNGSGHGHQRQGSMGRTRGPSWTQKQWRDVMNSGNSNGQPQDGPSEVTSVPEETSPSKSQQ